MRKLFRAINANPNKLRFPLLASAKIDGVRCSIVEQDGRLAKAVLRSLEDVPNDHIRTQLSRLAFYGLDGEIYLPMENRVASKQPLPDYNDVQSMVMTKAGVQPFTFHVFDDHSEPDLPYSQRIQNVEKRVARLRAEHGFDWIIAVPHLTVPNEDELMALHKVHLAWGFEGTVVRSRDGVYKQGTSSSVTQDYARIKMKEDAEAVIVGFEELMRNNNPVSKSKTGHTKRLGGRSGHTPSGVLGALVCEMPNGNRFKIGVFKGISMKVRQEMWESRDALLGMLAKYSFMHLTKNGEPRHSVFLGLRDARDLVEDEIQEREKTDD